MSAEPGQDALEDRQEPAHAARLDHEVPERLELLPTTGIGYVSQPSGRRVLRPRTAEDGPPPVEIPIGAPVARFERLGGHAPGAKNDVTGVVEVPVPVQEPPF